MYLPRPVHGDSNYAREWARTGFGIDTRVVPTPTIGLQIDTYLESEKPNQATLFVVSPAWFDLRLPGPPPESVSNLSSHVTTLAEAGARHFLVPNLMPVGSLPGAAPSPKVQGCLNLATAEFNALWTQELDALETQHDIEIVRVDFFGDNSGRARRPFGFWSDQCH